VKTYGYDLAGRTTSVVSSTGTTNIAYDFEGQATSIIGPGVSQTNLYNGLDTRVGSTTNSVARSFLRDGAYVTDPVLSDGAATYTPGVSERRGSTTTYLHSGLKNADAQSSPAQALTGTRQYDAFGNLASTTGTWQGPFGYAGGFGYQEDATGLKLLGHRLYDASTGRFLTRDPIKDGRNWYVYCDNDPIGATDPEGLDRIILHRNPGGIGMGSHLIMGLDDDAGNIIWVGFYLKEPGAGGKKAKGSANGSGYVQIGDKPKGGQDNQIDLPVSRAQRIAIRSRVMRSALDHLQGNGKHYSLGHYNCADWILEILCDILGIERPRKSSVTTPKEVQDWILTDQ